MATSLINGKAFAWSRIQFSVYGTVITGIRAVNYKEKQDKKDTVSAGVEPSTRHYGNKEYSGSVELEMREVQRIRAAVIANGGKSLLDAPPSPFTIEFLDDTVTYTHTLLNFEFLEDGNDLKQGSEVTATLPIIFAGVEYR
ncbi:hypothetical protein [Nodularia spumigena]|jgi:hypothetical protein|uniref:hypothetical protein n=1 Tax=Nodularia spumigena TaxID=70799 RepID=UPI00232C76C7|nr:hypothetical protein [Nodularia spumigena]MDB9498575.1 hypothetical protein [Nodularia spumigena CS-336/02]